MWFTSLRKEYPLKKNNTYVSEYIYIFFYLLIYLLQWVSALEPPLRTKIRQYQVRKSTSEATYTLSTWQQIKKIRFYRLVNLRRKEKSRKTGNGNSTIQMKQNWKGMVWKIVIRKILSLEVGSLKTYEEMVYRKWIRRKGNRGIFLSHEVTTGHISIEDSQTNQNHLLVSTPATR